MRTQMDNFQNLFLLRNINDKELLAMYVYINKCENIHFWNDSYENVYCICQYDVFKVPYFI